MTMNKIVVVHDNISNIFFRADKFVYGDWKVDHFCACLIVLGSHCWLKNEFLKIS